MVSVDEAENAQIDSDAANQLYQALLHGDSQAEKPCFYFWVLPYLNMLTYQIAPNIQEYLILVELRAIHVNTTNIVVGFRKLNSVLVLFYVYICSRGWIMDKRLLQEKKT